MADDLVTMAISVYMEKIRHPDHPHEQFIQNTENTIRKAYEHVETRLPELKEFSLAPIAIASAIGYIQFRLPQVAMRSKLTEWFTEFSKRPSMAQTIPVV